MDPEGRYAVSKQFLAGFSKRSRKVDTRAHTREERLGRGKRQRKERKRRVGQVIERWRDAYAHSRP